MSAHNNAIGYILDLKSTVRQNWFDLLVEHTLSNEEYCLDESSKQNIFNELIAGNIYSAKLITPFVSSQSGTPALTRETIVALHDFDNFKKLESYLTVNLHPRATIIFGANGAGKSSLCSAFKCLAGKTIDGPLHNLNNTSQDCSFKFDTTLNSNQQWQSVSPTSQLNSHIKFFDSKLALLYTSPKADPKKFIEITPYSLYLFELLKNYITDVENYWSNSLEKKKRTLTQSIDSSIAILQHLHSETANSFLEKNAQRDVLFIEEFIAKLDNATIANRLSKAKKEKDDFATAMQIEGKKLLSTEINALRNWISEVSSIAELMKNIDIKNYNATIEKLNKKRKEQATLVEKVIPQACDVEKFKIFLDASKSIFKYDGSECNCPFCQRGFTEKEQSLITEYAKFLISPLEDEISSLSKQANTIEGQILEIKNKDFSFILIRDRVLDKFKTSLKSILDTLKQQIDTFTQSIPQPELCISFENANTKLKELLTEANNYLQSRIDLETSANSNAEEQKQKFSELKTTVDALELEETLLNNIKTFNLIVSEIKEIEKIQLAIDTANIANVRRQLSTKSKQAYSELIVPQFQENLNLEYKRLAEREMSSFGVEFKSKVFDGDVSVESHVKSQKIDVVLSEGELKVHALALFFAELKYSSEDIIILDDPINSLDDKYSLSVGNRIRDCIKENPDKQIILLTHNYGFFIQLIQRFNKSSIGKEYVPLILESCGLIDKHTEKIDELEAKIENGIIAVPFDNEVKSFLAKYIRVYIESIVNTYVFNQCRKAYNLTQETSIFHNYMKIIPLTQEEATILSDIHNAVSPWEHDDIRTWYLNSDKVAFQTRYDKVKKVKAALVARKV